MDDVKKLHCSVPGYFQEGKSLAMILKDGISEIVSWKGLFHLTLVLLYFI